MTRMRNSMEQARINMKVIDRMADADARALCLKYDVDVSKRGRVGSNAREALAWIIRSVDLNPYYRR
jgi:hypothetical protein